MRDHGPNDDSTYMLLVYAYDMRPLRALLIVLKMSQVRCVRSLVGRGFLNGVPPQATTTAAVLSTILQ